MALSVRHLPTSKAAQLRALLQRQGPVLVVGAHDAISAKLVERAGFDAVWVSSFGVSAAQKCLPDANVLTMTESLEVAKNVNATVQIPVIADCDNGYGNAINLMRTVTEYEQAGIAGVSVEDSEFPKRCSLYPGAAHALVSVDEMVGRIRAAKAVQQRPDFLFIARVEALIAELGQEEALKRARAYAQAGADAILIHSKSSAADEIKAFAAAWDGAKPLVVVPTMFPTATADDLHAAGFKIIIFANHPLRAAIKAMREQLATLQSSRTAAAVKDQIAPLEEVYELVGVDELHEQERRFIPATGVAPASAVILAAGFEPQLMPLISDRPKAMLDIKGRSILERQAELLRGCGIQTISVVRGYRKERVALPSLRYFDNDRYAEGYILRSLFTAEEALQDRVLVLYGDILFDRHILMRLLASPADITVVMDRAWTDLARQRIEPVPEGTELIVTKEPPVVGRRVLPLNEPGTIIRIGQGIDPLDACGEFIGMILFSAHGMERFRAAYHHLCDAARNGHGQPGLPNPERAALTDLLQLMIDQGEPVASVDIYKGWLEIDTFDDYRKAWAQVAD